MTEMPASVPRYEDAVRGFRIEDEIARLHGDPASGINAYVECCGRYAGESRLALRAISVGGELSEYCFDDLADMSGRAQGPRRSSWRCRYRHAAAFPNWWP